MNKNLMTGTGMLEYIIDRENKSVSIDFTGQYRDECFRNDASIVFFAANSYKTSYYVLCDEIKHRFDLNNREKDIAHLIMPYYFSFRHSVELYIKAIIISISGTSPENTHKLSVLLDSLEHYLQDLNKPSDSRLNGIDFNNRKTTILEIFRELSVMVKKYETRESSEDYYRYIFGLDKQKDFILTKPKLFLDFPTTKELFNNAFHKIDELCKELRDADIYVYFTL